ncbi:hypothetical protein HAX54_034920, partial [Datura stramonium]|nr:hypothetical protein [Datura stramonium]
VLSLNRGLDKYVESIWSTTCVGKGPKRGAHGHHRATGRTKAEVGCKERYVAPATTCLEWRSRPTS